MRIAHIDIQNFRKLRYCRIELAKQETIFVGANNSGKTSAMDALIMFLKKSKRKEIATTDFTLSNWAEINGIGEGWVNLKDHDTPDLSIDSWRRILPSLDVWIEVDDSQIHRVSHILPSLDWDGGLLGVRLSFEPRSVEELYRCFTEASEAASNAIESRRSSVTGSTAPALSLWPNSMREFLERDLHKHLAVMAYVLDPSKADAMKPQIMPENSEPLEGDPFDGLIKIDIINAQRGFSDSNSGEGEAKTDRRLSSQLRHYFDEHLNPSMLPEASDLDALEAIEAARATFDQKLKSSFSPAISELEGLNYPGFSDPQILLSSKINPIEGLNHASAVQFSVTKEMDSATVPLWLPENYNGLGYRNLISMIFNLIRFRDEWMRVGKAGKKAIDENKAMEPLHLMLIEEPEAHLHAQVQQVFIKKAYSVLRNHSDLGEKTTFSTQMVVSTHSSHIAHETDFASLRYFRRHAAVRENDVPCASIVNLTTTFGDQSDTSKFVTRYLKTTHCDLFFADAAILVEGPAERMLVPHFIRCKYPELDRGYISVLEIGGSHAHRLRPLIKTLGLLTLVITDLDSIGANTTDKVRPATGQNFRTGNETLKTWMPKMNELDCLLEATDVDKVSSEGTTRVAFPSTITVQFQNGNVECAIPYTFEDALVLSNLNMFKLMTNTTGLIKKMAAAVCMATLDEACDAMFKALKSGKKAEMALDLLYTIEPCELEPPTYITEGLDWLQKKLRNHRAETVGAEVVSEAHIE